MNFVKLTTHRNGKSILVNMDTVGHVAVEDERTMLILANSDDGIPVMESFEQVEQLLFPQTASVVSLYEQQLIAAIRELCSALDAKDNIGVQAARHWTNKVLAKMTNRG